MEEYLVSQGAFIDGVNANGDLEYQTYSLNLETGNMDKVPGVAMRTSEEGKATGEYNFSFSSSVTGAGNNNLWDHWVGPGIIAAGQPLKFLKPYGYLGSRPGSSIASYTLRKVLCYPIDDLST